jgi:hypothetical protein
MFQKGVIKSVQKIIILSCLQKIIKNNNKSVQKIIILTKSMQKI